jgi:transketolase
MDNEIINLIRFISLKICENGQGHIGSFMSSAPILYVLYFKTMIYSPTNPKWFHRDRCILSNGHASLILYIVIYLTGGNITLTDLKNFNKLNNVVATHPKYNLHYGIETTTGPLGQGISNAVGMALGKKIYEQKTNIKSPTIYCVCGNGCLQEGISYESMSFAGKSQLNNLIIIYDDNNNTIDGNLSISFNEDIELRCKSMLWDYIKVEIGDTDFENIEKSIILAKNSNRPVLIRILTTIGYRTSYEDSHLAHHPANIDYTDIETFANELNIDLKSNWKIPKRLLKECNKQITKGKNNEKAFIKINKKTIAKYCNPNNDLDKLPLNTDKQLSISPRDWSGKCIEVIRNYNNVILGSADLILSTLRIKNPEYDNNIISFGIREHGMSGIANGLATTNIIPIISTMLVFSSYLMPSLRMSALSKHSVIYVFSYDSIISGLDGPTHGPIEILNQLRLIPNVLVLRPANPNEITISYKIALKNKKGPSCICLANNEIENFNNFENLDNIKKGGYNVYQVGLDCDIKLIVIATGGEVSVCMTSIKTNKIKNIRLVSMLCTQLYDLQDIQYKQWLLPDDIHKISIEAGNTNFWHKYANICYGIDKFGINGKGVDVIDYFNLSPKKLNEIIKSNIILPITKQVYTLVIYDKNYNQKEDLYNNFFEEENILELFSGFLNCKTVSDVKLYLSLINHIDSRFQPKISFKIQSLNYPIKLFKQNTAPIICYSQNDINNYLFNNKNVFMIQEIIDNYKNYEIIYHFKKGVNISKPLRVDKITSGFKYTEYNNINLEQILYPFLIEFNKNFQCNNSNDNVILYINMAEGPNKDIKILSCKTKDNANYHAHLLKKITQCDYIKYFKDDKQIINWTEFKYYYVNNSRLNIYVV